MLWHRTVGGAEGNKMYDVHGPVDGPEDDDGTEQPYGDICVHHIFTPYTLTDMIKNPTNGWTNSTGNRILVGNYSYYPRQGEGGVGWAYLNNVSDCVGYTLAGYGALRTSGQDVFNRNGDFKGRYRTVCVFLYRHGNSGPSSGTIPATLNDSDPPSVARNNGGSDTVKDGVVVTLDSGVYKQSKNTNPDTTEAEGSV